MRSIRLLAATTVIALFAAACGGDDDGGVGPNSDPVANFNAPTSCTATVACLFTDASTDPDGQVTAWSWAFGDGGTSTEQNPSYTYAAPGTYTVTLTVTDNGGATASTTRQVVIGGGTANTPPTAAFTVPACTVNVSCLFTDASTDADGSVTAWSWDFGDGTAPALEQNPSHTFASEGSYNVTLTVTDNQGATGTTTQAVTVTGGPTGQSCSAGTRLTDVICTITLAQRSSVTITLESEGCEIGGNSVLIPPPEPRAQSVFFNVCNLSTPQSRTLTDDTGAELVLEAGTQLPVLFRRGADPVAVSPQAQLTNNSASSWTIDIDDGGNPGAPGEPDFADVVLTVTATAR